MKKFKYDIAISFAGEDRKYADEIAKCLTENGINVFRDKYEEADMWGKNLYTHLDSVYQDEAKYCVMLISESYSKKQWTNHERASAQARAFKENEEYILPVRLDDTSIPGILGTIAYIDGKANTPKQICSLIIKKLGIKVNIPDKELEDPDFDIPIVKRKINDLEKKKYLKASFNQIESYFEKGLHLLRKNNAHVDIYFEKLSQSKFIAEVFVEGEKKTVCKIWISYGMISENSICFLQGTDRIDYNNDNSMNDWASVEDNGKEIFFRISDMGFGLLNEKINKERASAEDVAKYFWKRFIQYLEY
jgi:hypothetical protein